MKTFLWTRWHGGKRVIDPVRVTLPPNVDIRALKYGCPEVTSTGEIEVNCMEIDDFIILPDDLVIRKDGNSVSNEEFVAATRQLQIPTFRLPSFMREPARYLWKKGLPEGEFVVGSSLKGKPLSGYCAYSGGDATRFHLWNNNRVAHGGAFGFDHPIPIDKSPWQLPKSLNIPGEIVWTSSNTAGDMGGSWRGGWFIFCGLRVLKFNTSCPHTHH